MLIVLAICGGKLFHCFHSKTMDGKNDPSYALTWLNISLKHKLSFCAFEGNQDGVKNLKPS